MSIFKAANQYNLLIFSSFSLFLLFYMILQVRTRITINYQIIFVIYQPFSFTFSLLLELAELTTYKIIHNYYITTKIDGWLRL